MDIMPENRSLNDKFMLRLPDGMRERIRIAADRSGRSMNAEILAALEEKFPMPNVAEGLMIVQSYLEMLSAADDASPDFRSLKAQVDELNRRVSILADSHIAAEQSDGTTRVIIETSRKK